MEYKYDELLRSMDILRITTMMIDAGCWDNSDIRWSFDGDEFYDVVITALGDCCDFVCFGYKEHDEINTLYFSDPIMLEYYDLCREYGRRKGVKLKDNSYMKKAERVVRNHLYGPYTCWYTLNTKVNHERASGIYFCYDCYFSEEMELLERMLDIMQFYSDGVETLKTELAKPTALTVIYPMPATVWKAAA